MTAFALLLMVAAVGFGVSRWLRLPLIPLLLLGGAVLPRLGFESSPEYLGTVLELGLVFLVFASGIELNPERFSHHRKAVLWVGLTQFLVVGICGYGLARAMGLTPTAALYAAGTVSTSSTLVVLRHLRMQQQLFEPFGRLVTGVLLLQDLMMIVLIVVVSRLFQGWQAVLLGLGGVLSLMGLAVFCQRWFLPRLLVHRKMDEETLLLLVLAVLFAFVGLSLRLALPTIAGAFLAGVSFSAFPLNGVVRGQLSSLSDFFLAVFFTALGAIVVIPSVQTLLQALALGLLVVLVTPPLVTILAERFGLASRSAIEAGLLLAQVSEFSLVLGLTGMLLGKIPEELFSMIALVAALTMTLTPFIATDGVTRGLLHWHPLRRRWSTESFHSGHVLVLGFGASGMWVIKPLLAQGDEVLVVDDDPVVIRQLEQLNVPCLRGDGSDEKVLAQAGASEARLILSGMRRVSESEKLLKHVHGVPVVVRLFEQEDAERVRQLGGIPILNSMAAAETFMEWFVKTGRVGG